MLRVSPVPSHILPTGVDMELAGGAVILVAGAGARLKRELADAADAAAAAAKARRSAPCPAVSGDGDNERSDAALLERLTALSALAHGSARGFIGSGSGGGAGRRREVEEGGQHVRHAGRVETGPGGRGEGLCGQCG